MLYNLIIAYNTLHEKTRTNHGQKHPKQRKSFGSYDQRIHQAGNHSPF